MREINVKSSKGSRYIKVTNGVNTTGRKWPSGYTSWLDFWEKNRFQASFCYSVGCTETEDLVGAHVEKVEGNLYPNSPKLKGDLFIIPLCKKCNGKSEKEIFEVIGGYKNANLIPEKNQ